MSRFTDAVVGYRILRLLSTPIEKSDAYRLGIIDKDGNKLKDPIGSQEMDSYSLLQRFVFKVQKALMKSPDRNAKRLLTFAAALAILREYKETDEEDVELMLEVFMEDENVKKQAELLENGLLSFKNYNIDEMMSAGGGGIAGIGTGPADQKEPGRDPVFMPMVRRKNKKKKQNATTNTRTRS